MDMLAVMMMQEMLESKKRDRAREDIQLEILKLDLEAKRKAAL
jgi:hypothetical protein